MTATVSQEALNREERVALERILSLNDKKRARLIELVGLYDASDDCDEKKGIENAVAEILFRRAGDLIAEPLDDAGGSDGKQRLAKHREYVANQIIKHRVQAGWSQEELAERAGLPQSHISRLERRVHAPTHLTLQKLASAFGIAVSLLDPSFDE